MTGVSFEMRFAFPFDAVVVAIRVAIHFCPFICVPCIVHNVMQCNLRNVVHSIKVYESIWLVRKLCATSNTNWEAHTLLRNRIIWTACQWDLEWTECERIIVRMGFVLTSANLASVAPICSVGFLFGLWISTKCDLFSVELFIVWLGYNLCNQWWRIGQYATAASIAGQQIARVLVWTCSRRIFRNALIERGKRRHKCCNGSSRSRAISIPCDHVKPNHNSIIIFYSCHIRTMVQFATFIVFTWKSMTRQPLGQPHESLSQSVKERTMWSIRIVVSNGEIIVRSFLESNESLTQPLQVLRMATEARLTFVFSFFCDEFFVPIGYIFCMSL